MPEPSVSAVAPVAKKKSTLSTGCLVALGVMAALFLACFVATVMFLKSDAGAAMVDVIDQARAGASAPGAAEVKAAGCLMAIVLDEAEMEATFNKHFDAGLEARGHSMTVVCSVSGSTGPECDTLAQVYAKAVGGTAIGPVKVMVQGSGSNVLCSKQYDAQGAPTP